MATVYKGGFVPEVIYKEFDIDIALPEEYLPFVKIEKTVKPLPGSFAVTALPYIESTWINIPWYTVTGDGGKIYDGPGGITSYNAYNYVAKKYVHPQADLDAGYFLESKTRKVYRGEVEYTDTGTGKKYKVSGTLRTVSMTDITASGYCGDDTENYFIQYDADLSDSEPYTYISAINSTTISGKWKKRELTWTESPPTVCVQSSVVTDEVIATKSWSAFSSVTQVFIDALKYEWNGSDWVYLGSGSWQIDEGGGDVVTSREYSFYGYWLYYSTECRWFFQIGDNNADGIYDDLIGTPNVEGLQYPHPLPYTSMNLLMNPGDHPLGIDTEKTVYSDARDEEPIAFCKVRELPSGIPVYNIQSKISCLIKAPAIVESPGSPSFNVADNTWTKIYNETWPEGYGYSKTIENLTTKTKPIYIGEQNDIPIRLRIFLSNPFFYKEDRKYINAE